jgi:hypothetical protein
LDVVEHGVIAFLGLGGRDIPDRLEQSPVVEPVDPFQRGVFDGFEGSPGASSVDDLGLVKAVDRFGQGVVIAVTDAATDGSIPASARRSVYLIDRYWLPRSL